MVDANGSDGVEESDGVGGGDEASVCKGSIVSCLLSHDISLLSSQVFPQVILQYFKVHLFFHIVWKIEAILGFEI